MNDIQYIGEHLLPGQVGHFAIILGFVASLLAAVAYFFATQKRDTPQFSSWKNIGRGAFLIQSISLVAIVGIFFYILTNNYYEYQYVWANTSDTLPFEYVFAAFWKDQEGSFLLWLFWQMVLGLILLWKSGKWESPVLSTLSLVQAFIFSMILGLYIGFGEDPLKIGINPFLLLRDVMDAPIFAKADYLTMLDGQGLNPLLQNYWMTIHPPTLFLGFASTVVPFCYAIAGLWTREYKAWLQPALPWALFSGAILGLGILMGGAWAYEALTFGGYWAWDPVENMSLVPWLVLVAGIHMHLVAKSTGHSLRSTLLFYILTFVLILYSTFLTRSGVLGETSVHSFTEMGLENHLLLFIIVFAIVGFIPFLLRYKKIPTPEKEEAVSSKEFWMFIGALVLIFSAAMITASTSLPVYNKIRTAFDEDFAGSVINDPIDHYNRYQLWIAVLIAALSGGTQFLRFREMNWSRQAPKYYKHLVRSLGLAGAGTALLLLWIEAYAWQYILLLFAAMFTIISNTDYVFSYLKNNLKSAGSAFSHIGFGIMIVGIMASGINKHHISKNELVMQELLENERLSKNIVLYKGLPMFMSGYEVVYTGDTIDGHHRYFNINFKKLNEQGRVEQEFTLEPNVLYDNQFTKVAAVNPDTRHYLHKDIYTHIASLPAAQISLEEAEAVEDSLDYKNFEGVLGDSIETEKNIVIFRKIIKDAKHHDYKPEPGDLAIGVELGLTRAGFDTVYTARPIIVLRGQLVYTYPVQINELGVKVKPREEIFESVYTPEELLDYQPFTLRQGEDINLNGYNIRFEGFDKNITHSGYKEEKGDIAVSAVLQVSKGSEQYTAEPVYLIRDNQPFNLKDEIIPIGMHFRFTSIDPVKETVTLSIAQTTRRNQIVPISMAENAFRNDFIVLEAIVFPGINLFWVGSIMMLFGLALAMWHRIQLRRR